MSVNNVLSLSSFCVCSGPDYEEQQIIALLRRYGLSPTGNKSVDKAKLRNIEMQQAKMQNEPCGKFLTISYDKEKEIIDKKIERLYGTKKDQKKEQNKEVFREDEILGRQILAIIEMKQREEKDIKKSKELRIDKPNYKIKTQNTEKSDKKSLLYMPQIYVLPEMQTSELKVVNVNTKNNI